MEKNDKLELIGVIATLSDQLRDTEENKEHWLNEWIKADEKTRELEGEVKGLQNKIFNLESELKIAKGE